MDLFRTPLKQTIARTLQFSSYFQIFHGKHHSKLQISQSSSNISIFTFLYARCRRQTLNMQRYNQNIEGIKRGTNTDITKVKAVSRIQLAGTSQMRKVGNANVFLQNNNYRGLDALGAPLWRKTGPELDAEDANRGKFLGYWKGVLRLWGNKVITNKQDTDADTRYEIAKLVRAWPGFPLKTRLRLWDQSKSRHQACLEALQNLSNKENEKERTTKNATRVINLEDFIINAPVTVLCLLPEEHPNLVEDDLVCQTPSVAS